MSEKASDAKNLAPGMDYVCEAGETLVIQDGAGQELSITGRESPEVMEFLKAFDEWFFGKQRRFSDGILAALWAQVQTTFNALPLRVQKELPSWTTIGVSVRNHDHV